MALVRDLEGKRGVDSKGRQYGGVFVGVETAQVCVLQRVTAFLRGRWWVRRLGCWQTGHEPRDGHLAYGLGVGHGGQNDQYGQEHHICTGLHVEIICSSRSF